MPEWIPILSICLLALTGLAGSTQVANNVNSATKKPVDPRPLIIGIAIFSLLMFSGAISKSFGRDKDRQSSNQAIKDFQTPPNLGHANSLGYYRLPQPRRGLYAIDSVRTPPGQRCGSKTVIGVAYTLALKWRAKYPDSRLEIWDLNAPDHLSHSRGIDIDITTTNRSGGNTAGSNDRSIQLGKWAVDTGKVSVIYYNDPVVQRAVNAYAGRVVMSYWDDHEDHFHLRVHPQYAGSTSYYC